MDEGNLRCGALERVFGLEKYFEKPSWRLLARAQATAFRDGKRIKPHPGSETGKKASQEIPEIFPFLNLVCVSLPLSARPGAYMPGKWKSQPYACVFQPASNELPAV